MSKSLEALEFYWKCGNLTQTDYELIKQDLERLEQLEKENQELKEELEIEKFDWFIVLNNKLDRYKKAIEILKRDFQFQIENNFLWIYDNYCGALESFSLSEDEINLLKEVLE